MAISARFSRTARTGLVTLALLGVALLTGCAFNANVADPEARLRVENRSTEDVTVWVIPDGSPIYLGIVPGLERRTFRINGAQYGSDGDVRFMARHHSDDDHYVSGDVPFGEGGAVVFRVEQHIHLSSVMPII